MRDIIIPNKLKPGDTIGIISPSSGIASLCPKRLERGIQTLREMNFEVVLGKNTTARQHYMAGTIEQRLEDLHEMFSNPDVKAIITTIGGTCSHQLLDEIDYELIARNPKVFMGYSDITALHTAIHKKTGLVTYLGPAILPQFGEFNGLIDYTREYFQKTLLEKNHVSIKSSPYRIVESLMWDTEDTRVRQKEQNSGLKILKTGSAEGHIVAGNVCTLLLLAGTQYFPDMTGAILCIEGSEGENPSTIDRYFTQLRHMGVYDKISGLLIGRFHPKVGFGDDHDNGLLQNILQTTTRGYTFPIVYNADFGHTDPMFILPNGIEALLKASEGSTSFEFLQPAVL
ncbi:S66 family peptidase [Bacillus sp. DJP31]|uniref:S66 family peptidase n=1 Tax=Bacillus sp. DJP31 TaxID=3409789 RepID=UPI003BB80504